MASLLSLPTACPTRWKRNPLKSRLGAGLMLLAAMLFSTATPLRADLAEDFLTGLRQRGWHDVALESLDEAAQDPLVTSEFQKNIGFHRATTQTDLARQAVNEKQRQSLLVAAATGFQQFAQEQPQSPLQLQALATAGRLFNEQALQAINQVTRLPQAARRQREQLQSSARDFLTQARQPLESLLEQSEIQLKSLPKAAELQKNPTSKVTRRQLQAKQAEAKFMLAKLDYNKSQTYAPDSKAHRQALDTAASAFAEIYKEYDEKLVGFYGRLYQGRCHQGAGDFKQALNCFWDIVDQPPIPNQDFRRLVARAYRYRAECHLSSEDFELAIKECREWLDESRGAELSEPEWLAVSYQLANAYEAKADSASGRDSQQLRTKARKLYREIAKKPGEFQGDAKARITSTGKSHEKPVLVNSFDEAFEAGKSALQQMHSANFAARIAKKNNPDSVDSLREQAETNETTARRYFQQAVQFADEQTDREQVAAARYYLCWLYWEDGRLEEAAIIGEFLARRYPENKYAPLAAKIALAAYERSYNATKQSGEAADFEAQHLAEVAELLATRWPGSPEAAAGLNLLINLSLKNDRLADAEALLERLPPSSRAAAELRLGGVLWNRFLRASHQNQAGPEAEVLALKKKAGQMLASGYQSLKSKPQATAVEVTGVLYFAQFLLADGAAQQAVEVLEHASVGPLSLIENNSLSTRRDDFLQKTYRVALRAYVSVEPPQRDKAQKMMTALESAVGEKKNAQQQLINIYVSLGLELQQQISALTAEGHAKKARAVAESFEDLLARVTKRAGAAGDWKIQSWIAQTNLQLGQGLRDKDADRYYQKATAAYQALLSKAAQDADFAPSPLALLATKKRLADCLQAQKKYAEAFELYSSILRTQPNMLELQRAAATALQQWGTQSEDAKRLEESIRGAKPQANNKKNLIWGWLRFAAIVDQAQRKAKQKAGGKPDSTGKVAKYQDLFFEARYHAAQARFAAAKLATGNARKKQIQTARKSLESMKRLYPDLGGPRWQGAYLQLLKQMEEAQ